MEDLLFYLAGLWTFHNVLLVFLGVLGGILVGALPGLTPTMGVALLVPFTFHLPPQEGLIMLGSVYVGSVYGGAITAILINIPGAPASIATLFDGHPMARKGEADRAIHLATLASFIGGTVGVLLLLLFAPSLSRVSLNFGPAEHFWVAIFGITVIASLSVGSLWKGLLAGSCGLFLSTVGISEITGVARFTFGSSHLAGGIGIVSCLIGLFALPQAMTFFEQQTPQAPPKTQVGPGQSILKTHKSLFQALDNLWRYRIVVGLGSIIGSLVGLIPGAGGQVAGLVAYNEVKRRSKDQEKFGKGCPEGILVTESANNAMVGCSLVPLLTLGIPGSPTAAILLGGLLMNGLWPGPGLFQENASVTYTFILGLLLAQFVMLVIGVVGARLFQRVMTVSHGVMAPLILVLCVIGSFAARNNFSDVLVMVAIGLAMTVGQKAGFSPAPVALGFILGEYAERGLLLAQRASSSTGSLFLHFLDRPIVIVLMGLTALSLVTTAVLEYRRIKTARTNQKPEQTHVQSTVGQGNLDLVISLTALVAGGLLLTVGLSYPSEAHIFPLTAIAAGLVFALIQAGLTLWEKTQLGKQGDEPQNLPGMGAGLGKMAVVNASLIAYTVIIPVVGFFASTWFLLLGLFNSFHRVKVITNFMLATAISAGLLIVFREVLAVPFPRGFLM